MALFLNLSRVEVHDGMDAPLRTFLQMRREGCIVSRFQVFGMHSRRKVPSGKTTRHRDTAFPPRARTASSARCQVGARSKLHAVRLRGEAHDIRDLLAIFEKHNITARIHGQKDAHSIYPRAITQKPRSLPFRDTTHRLTRPASAISHLIQVSQRTSPKRLKSTSYMQLLRVRDKCF